MSLRARHRVWVWLAAAFAAMISAGAVLGATASPDRRAALWSQLRHPALVKSAQTAAAPVTVRARRGRARLVLDGRTYAVELSPGLASVRNRLALAVMANGARIGGARVTVAFSMPAMNMWHAFSVTLTSTAGRAYVTTMPFVGMPGTWRLDFRVALADRRPAAFAVVDELGA